MINDPYFWLAIVCIVWVLVRLVGDSVFYWQYERERKPPKKKPMKKEDLDELRDLIKKT